MTLPTAASSEAQCRTGPTGDEIGIQVRALGFELARKLGEQVIRPSGAAPNGSGPGATFTGAPLIGAGNGAAGGAAPTVADFAELLSRVTAAEPG